MTSAISDVQAHRLPNMGWQGRHLEIVERRKRCMVPIHVGGTSVRSRFYPCVEALQLKEGERSCRCWSVEIRVGNGMYASCCRKELMTYKVFLEWRRVPAGFDLWA